MLNELNPSNFCILGDLNACIGEAQILHKNEYNTRCSKDKTINWQGKCLLEAMENIGGIVLNGISVGDVQGNYSFCGVMGNSVIDYCVVSYSFLQIINNFFVASKPYSDHMPLIAEIQIPNNLHQVSSKLIVPRLFWNEKNSKQYKQNLINSKSFVQNMSVEKMVDTIVENIKSSNVKSSRKSHFVPKQKWFDWRCFRYRKSMIRNLLTFRMSNSSIDKFKYMTAKSRYLNLCAKKRLIF